MPNRRASLRGGQKISKNAEPKNVEWARSVEELKTAERKNVGARDKAFVALLEEEYVQYNAAHNTNLTRLYEGINKSKLKLCVQWVDRFDGTKRRNTGCVDFGDRARKEFLNGHRSRHQNILCMGWFQALDSEIRWMKNLSETDARQIRLRLLTRIYNAGAKAGRRELICSQTLKNQLVLKWIQDNVDSTFSADKGKEYLQNLLAGRSPVSNLTSPEASCSPRIPDTAPNEQCFVPPFPLYDVITQLRMEMSQIARGQQDRIMQLEAQVMALQNHNSPPFFATPLAPVFPEVPPPTVPFGSFSNDATRWTNFANDGQTQTNEDVIPFFDQSRNFDS